MAHPFKSQSDASVSRRLKKLGAKAGKAWGSSSMASKTSYPKKNAGSQVPYFADGGSVGPRPDRMARGGGKKGKGGHTTNIIIGLPKSEQAPGPALPMPPPALAGGLPARPPVPLPPVAPAAGPPALPPRPPLPVGGLPRPPVMKRGGSVGFKKGGNVKKESAAQEAKDTPAHEAKESPAMEEAEHMQAGGPARPMNAGRPTAAIPARPAPAQMRPGMGMRPPMPPAAAMGRPMGGPMPARPSMMAARQALLARRAANQATGATVRAAAAGMKKGGSVGGTAQFGENRPAKVVAKDGTQYGGGTGGIGSGGGTKQFGEAGGYPVMHAGNSGVGRLEKRKKLPV